MARSDIVVSTARHEFYGLSVLEAAAARCYPLLPNRLSYPELIPTSIHGQILYDTPEELGRKLTSLCRDGIPSFPAELTESVSRVCWSKLIESYDEAFERYIGDQSWDSD
ncbi:MAG: glycosyltransferase family 4 protein [Planctomycetes bacterium]|nr:glycosyltransferase family 4 protein [Planctomycetota bacterium]